MTLNEALQNEIAALKEKGLSRSLRVGAPIHGRIIVFGGKECVNFCSNDYLALADDSRLVAAAIAALQKSGVGGGAARLVSGHREEHALLEKDIAALKGTEAALAFSSGYMANTGIIPALVGHHDVVFSDRLNHASIIDGILLSRARMERYRHLDMAELEVMLVRARGARRRLIVTDTVFSMDGDEAPLRALTALAQRYDAWLMVDEAHAMGVLGPSGAGLAEDLGVADQVQVQMGTLSKAAGVMGAYAAGDKVLIEHLLNQARSFVFTTAMPPAMAAAAREGLRIIRSDHARRQRLLENAARLRAGLRSLGLSVPEGRTPIIPVLIGEADRAVQWSRALELKGVFISAIRPPTVPPGTARLRVTVTAGHTDDDIARCLEVFKSVRI